MKERRCLGPRVEIRRAAGDVDGTLSPQFLVAEGTRLFVWGIVAPRLSVTIQYIQYWVANQPAVLKKRQA